jgi:phosphate transport system protein
MPNLTRREYQDELSRVRRLLAEMGELTVRQLGIAFDAAEQALPRLAAQVLEREPEADRLEHEVDGLVVRLIALQQPVARDLREILAALRIANELERICDHAANMSTRLIALDARLVEPARSLVKLGRFSTTMVQDAMRAFATSDDALAQDVWGRDRQLDEMYTAFYRELIAYMMEDVHRIAQGAHILFIARDIERVGDRATNIAEMSIYRTRGVPLGEERPKADATKTLTLQSKPADI